MRLPGGRGSLFLVAMLLIAGLIIIAGSGRPADSPEHRSDSDGPNGTSALLQFAQAQGHSTRTMLTAFSPARDTRLLFLFTPTADVTSDDIDALLPWLDGGGILVYADEQGGNRLDKELHLARPEATALGRGTGVRDLLPGVGSVSGSDAVIPFRPGPDQVVLVRGTRGEALAIMARLGFGRVVALADPAELTNAHIAQDDNWRLAADLMALAPAGAAIAFDEFHHSVGGSSGSVYDVFVYPWAQALLVAAVLIFFGLALRGRAFGTRLPLSPDTGRPTQEYVNAVGTLLKRTQARRLTLDVLKAATRRQLLTRIGVASGGPGADEALERRAPELAAGLAGVEAGSAGAVESDRGLLEAARLLHHLAHPAPEVTS